MKDLCSKKRELICKKNMRNKLKKSDQLYQAKLKILKKFMIRKSQNY